MARARVGGLSRKAGINPVPIVIFVLVAAVAGAGLFAWDYSWRKKQEEATKPPAPDVLVRGLIENIIGKDAVKALKVDQAAGTVTVTFESATFKPEDAQKNPAQSRKYVSAEAELAGGVLLNSPPQLAAQVPFLAQLQKVDLTIVHRGATLATAVAERGKEIQVTFVDSRLK